MGLVMRVSRCPWNDPLGAKERGGRGWLRLWGGGGGTVCVSLSDGDAPSAPELTVGDDVDAVDWYAPSPPGIVLQGGNETRGRLLG